MVMSCFTEISGEVKAANAKGVLLIGRGEWANWSKWAEQVVTPQPGERVTLGLDKGGYIRSILSGELVPEVAAAAPTAPPAPLPAADRLSQPESLP
jgi:hypothetical protein